VVVERLGDPSIFGVVPVHEALVQPLPLRAATEEQNGGVRVGGTDDRPCGVKSSRYTLRGGPQ
jgi:hypothetical protein